MADFSGLDGLNEIVLNTLNKLSKTHAVNAVSSKVGGSWRAEDFDMWFAELVRKELGKTLGMIRNKAVDRARSAGAGSAASAVSRRTYKDRLGGNVNILSSKDRKSRNKRAYTPGLQRTVSRRTKALNEYFGPDRDFILRFLDGGTDARTVDPNGATGRGSRASWGRRGAITPRQFFHTMGSDMEQAAQAMGESIVGRVEQFIEYNIQRHNG